MTFNPSKPAKPLRAPERESALGTVSAGGLESA